uniref:Cytochrome P450 CYP749A22-like n=1 Tax=Kalanchoe fedtschenkoi TaxID=63787 RepID=A0A7N0VGQ3_KALFE
MLPEMVAGTETMLRKWREYEGLEVDVFEEFRLLTSDVISRTAFGSSYAEGHTIFEMLAKLITIMFSNFLFKTKIPLISRIVRDKNENEILKLQKGIRSSMIRMVHDREDRVKKGDAEGYGDDFLGVLVKAYKDLDHSRKMSLDEVIDECRTFYVAGQETTNATLSWVMFLLAIHQNWQEEARREVVRVFGNESPNQDGIAKLKIMGMILNETLRLYPAIAGQVRNTAKEVKLGSLVLPANTNLFVPMLAIHHDPEIWGKDVHEFKPERFAEGIAKATNNNVTAFIPFGLGPRICAGINFAMHEAKIALSMILQRYKFTLSDSYVHSPVTVLTIRPQYGVKVVLQSV